jgi:hypothetical protein
MTVQNVITPSGTTSVDGFHFSGIVANVSEDISEVIVSRDIRSRGSGCFPEGVGDESMTPENEPISSEGRSADLIAISDGEIDGLGVISEPIIPSDVMAFESVDISDGISDESKKVDDEPIASADRSVSYFDDSGGIVHESQPFSPPDSHAPDSPPPPFLEEEEEEEEPPGAPDGSGTFSSLRLASDSLDSQSDHEAEHDTSQASIGSAVDRCDDSSRFELVILDESPEDEQPESGHPHETGRSSTDHTEVEKKDDLSKQSHGSRDTSKQSESVEIRLRRVTRLEQALARPGLILIYVLLFFITVATWDGNDERKM